MNTKALVGYFVGLVISLNLNIGYSANTTGDVSHQPDDLIRVIPEDLFQYGRQRNCLQINSFYKDRPGVTQPPYVFGLMTKKPNVAKGRDGKPIWFNDYSAAFWCHKEGDKPREFTLLLNFDGGTLGMGSCPETIEKQEYIGGLSVIELSHDPLTEYFDPITKAKYNGAGVETATGPAILSEYDGVGFVYYCYKKHWLVKALD